MMLDPPKTKKEAQQYRYNKWAGNPQGRAYNPTQCVYEVHESGRGYMFYQCSRKSGHGPDNLYCKQHAKMVDSQRTNARLSELGYSTFRPPN